jgi:hypothetical protein
MDLLAADLYLLDQLQQLLRYLRSLLGKLKVA